MPNIQQAHSVFSAFTLQNSERTTNVDNLIQSKFATRVTEIARNFILPSATVTACAKDLAQTYRNKDGKFANAVASTFRLGRQDVEKGGSAYQQKLCKYHAMKGLLDRLELVSSRAGSRVPVVNQLQAELGGLVRELKNELRLFGISEKLIRTEVSNAFVALNPLLSAISNSNAQSSLSQSFNAEGVYEKKLPNQTDVGSSVVCPTGNRYRLLNTLTPSAMAEIKRDFGVDLSKIAEAGRANNHKVVLGKGGYGKVRLAVNQDNQIMAVKKLENVNQAKTEQITSASVRSAIVASGGDPNSIAQIEDGAHIKRPNRALSRIEQNKSYLFMEYASGGDGLTVASQLQKVKQTDRERHKQLALHIGHQVCQAVATLHNAGLAHRDIKPENFLSRIPIQSADPADFNETVLMLADFGGVYPKDLPSSRCVHTTRFLPPEPHAIMLPHRHDAFSLGLTLLEMISLPVHVNFGGYMLKTTDMRGARDNVFLAKDMTRGNFRGAARADAIAIAERYPTPSNIVVALLQPNPSERMSAQQAAALFARAAKM